LLAKAGSGGGLGDAATVSPGEAKSGGALGGGRDRLGGAVAGLLAEAGFGGGLGGAVAALRPEAESGDALGGGRDGLSGALAEAESGGALGGGRDGLSGALAALLATESGDALGGGDGLGGAVRLLEGLLEPRAVRDEVVPGGLTRLPADRRAALRRLLEARR
jgi:hypothetical protein